jgi:hypothetical protein
MHNGITIFAQTTYILARGNNVLPELVLGTFVRAHVADISPVTPGQTDHLLENNPGRLHLLGRPAAVQHVLCG